MAKFTCTSEVIVSYNRDISVALSVAQQDFLYYLLKLIFYLILWRLLENSNNTRQIDLLWISETVENICVGWGRPWNKIDNIV